MADPGLAEIMGMGGDMPPGPDMEDDDYGIPEEYTAWISEALPDLNEDQQAALWEAIAACVEALR